LHLCLRSFPDGFVQRCDSFLTVIELAYPFSDLDIGSREHRFHELLGTELLEVASGNSAACALAGRDADHLDQVAQRLHLLFPRRHTPPLVLTTQDHRAGRISFDDS
jgi:hypothetical protein